MASIYNPSKIELKWQKFWEDNKTYQTTRFANKKKKYVLDMFPYPSGAGLHVGHTLGFIATDIYSRYLRMIGYNVLHPMGWDAFGLPAENYAIRTGTDPQTTTRINTSNFKRQLKSLGLSYDWDKEINTSLPEYYKWTQWIFLKLYENGLAYRKKAAVNWCNNCQTVLANEQVKGNKCERCGTEVVQKELEQWFFRITQYAEDLLSDLENLDWPEPIKAMQRNWIGKSEGATIKFKVKSEKSKVEDIDVFTTRPDTLFGATYVVIAPDSDRINNLKFIINNWEQVEKYIEETKKKTDVQRTDLNKEKTGVELKGVVAINPVNNSEIPIWIADYVLSGYGTGAIMAVPAHDERDFEFAKKYNIKIISVFESSDIPYVGQGKLINSAEFNGLGSSDSKDKITVFAGGKLAISYKLRDWLISRQRYWGAPIPIIYCEKCGMVTVPEEQLPVLLPTDVDFKPTGESPLVHSRSFHNVKCPKCHSPARRESDTMDTFVDSSWYFLRYIDPSNKNEFAAKELIEKWMPVDMYVGGAEHAVMHLLYARFIAKALRDIGLINFDEPFISLRNQGLILAEDGRKMSKSLGNVINPDDVVEKYGADTFRVYEMFMGPLEDSKPWSTRNIIGSYRFLENIWKFGIDPTFSHEDNKVEFENLKIKVTHDIESLGFNTAIAELMKFIKITKLKITKNTWKDFLILISPFVPHLAEELWKRSHFEGLISDHSWVKIDNNIIGSKYITIPVQINNKVRTVIKISKSATLADIKRMILQDSKVSSRILDKKYKLIYVPLKIVSIVVYN